MSDTLVKPLLTERNHMAYPSDYARTIQAFKDLITRDRGSKDDSQGRKKYQAAREFAYIYFMEDPSSPYYSLPKEEKKAKIISQVFPEEWEPDDKVKKAQEVYRNSVESISVRLLRSAYKSIHELRDYFETVDLQERDDNGKPIHKAKDVIKSLSDLGSVVEGLEKLEERVKAEKKDKDNQIRGGVELNPFNE